MGRPQMRLMSAADELKLSEKETVSPDLRAFIDRLIVPLLVDLFNKGHLYTAEVPRYDDAAGLPEAA